MQTFIQHFLSTADIKKEYVKMLTSPFSMSYYNTAFTDPSYDNENNYLFLRALGKLTYDKILVWYLFERFPYVNQEKLTQLKIIFVSANINLLKDEISKYILHDPKIILGDKIYQNVFEAMIASTEFVMNQKYKFGVGNVVVKKICKYYLDQFDIVFSEQADTIIINGVEHPLKDFKTKLKEEFFDAYRLKKQSEQTKDEDTKIFKFTLLIFQNKFEGSGLTLIDAEREASKKAYLFLKKNGNIKERYKEEIQRSTYDNRNMDEFKDFILNLLKPFSLKDLKFEKEDVDTFKKAFTLPADSPQNYEVLETLGDNILNRCVFWYISSRFPELNTPEGIDISTKLKIKMIQTDGFGKNAKKLGFYKFISNGKQNEIEKKVLEDVFESFFAALEIVMDRKYEEGTGYIICYKLLASILDEEEISLKYDYLVDVKTQLKELYDRYHMGVVVYKNERVQNGFYSTIVIDKKVVRGFGGTDKEAQQNVSKLALEVYRELGKFKPIPKEYLKFCV